MMPNTLVKDRKIMILKIAYNSFRIFLLILLISYSTLAQTDVSDLKLVGLKGPVKSLVSSSKAISGYVEWVLKDKTKHQRTDFFDRQGNLTESLSESQSTYKYIYSKVDGNKTFKMTELKRSQNAFSVAVDSNEVPIETGEKLVKPDERFDFKYIYETSENGRLITERQYSNNGKLFRKRIYEFNTVGQIVKTIEDDTGAKMVFTYQYNNNGILIEENESRDIKQNGSDSKSTTLYTDYKLDSNGNWTERKRTKKSKVDGMPKYNIPEEEYTFVNIEYRTITYYANRTKRKK